MPQSRTLVVVGGGSRTLPFSHGSKSEICDMAVNNTSSLRISLTLNFLCSLFHVASVPSSSSYNLQEELCGSSYTMTLAFSHGTQCSLS